MVVAGERRADGADDRGEMVGAAIGEIVAVDRGDDGMGQAHPGHGIRHILRLVGIERRPASRS